MTLKNNRNRLIPFLWIYLISGVTAAILFYGFKAAESRQKHTLQLEQAEQAEETLATLAFGSRFQPYLTRISADLKKTLISHINNSARDKNPQRKFLSANFPENELWVFKSRKETSKPEAVFYPSNSRTSRSGMINLFSALNSLDFSTGKDKLADFLFGPGLKISTLIKRKNRPTRIIYQNKHHYLLWDTIDSQGKNVGGFFLLIPDGPELTRFAMQRTADRLSSLDGPAIQFAGFLNLFSKDVNTICNKDFVLNSGLNEELKKIAANSSLKNLETSSLPYGKKVENWKIYTKAIAQSTHLAFVFIKEDLAKTRTFSISSFISTAYILVGVILLFIFIANCQLPPLNLRIRFFLLFSALASIPFSMLMISAQVYLEELRITLMRETRQNLQDSIGFFDQNVNDSYLLYQNEFKRLHQEPWIKEFEGNKIPVCKELDGNLKEFFKKLSPPLPWGSLVIADQEGRSILNFSSPEHKNGLEGYMKFNRIGIIESIRNRKGLPSIEITGKSDFISEEDITLKKAYETQVKLPIYHAFSNAHAGVTIQIAFGNLSIIRIVDYFPSEKSPLFGFSVAWNENDLDKEFSLMAIKKWRKEHPSLQFEIFKKDNENLDLFGASHKNSNLFKTAYSTALQERPVFFHDKTAQTIEIGVPSEKRPGLYLVAKTGILSVQKRIEAVRNRLFLFLFLGMWALLFFRDFLFKRLIQPLLLLEKTLKSISSGIMTKLPVNERHDEINDIFLSFNEMIDGVKARNRLLSLVSGTALNAAGNEKDDQPEIGRNRFAISLVSDIREFTRLCETHEPEVITSLLNHHFDQMTRIIHSFGGEISRFVGDAIEATFLCPPEVQSQIAEKAINASILMLESVRIINEERKRQNLFTYRIGIGLASGEINIFKAGQQNSRQEILRLGNSQIIAAKLESFSRDFSNCPLIVDEKTVSLLSKNCYLNRNLKPCEIDQTPFFFFEEFPGIPEISLEELSEPSNKDAQVNLDKIFENFRIARPSFLQGLLILLVPFLIVFFALLTSQERSLNLVREKARKNNQNTIKTANLKNSHREIISLQFQSFLEKKHPEIIRSLETIDKSQKETVKNLIKKELDFYGLIVRNIILLSFNESSKKIKADNKEEALKYALAQGLKCYNSNLDRYLVPEEETLKIFDDSFTPIMFSRDGRANFVQTMVASSSSWVYWQPLLNKPEKWQNLFENPAEWQTKLYGTPPDNYLSNLLAGGILVVCDSPSDVSALRVRRGLDSSCYARISIKESKIEEKSGNFNDLNGFENFSRLSPAEAAEFLISQSHKTFTDNSDLVADHVLLGGSDPEIRIALSSISLEKNEILRKNRPLFIALLFFLTASIIVWLLANREKALASTVAGQIIGGFTGAIMIPVAGIIFILYLLHGDLRTNLIEQSREDFLKNVDQLEQKITFHQVKNPIRMQDFFQKHFNPAFLRTDLCKKSSPDDFLRTQKKLQSFLMTFFQFFFREKRAIGLNSLMIDISNGLSESLLLYGILAAPCDPMKRTFSYHARQILRRLNPKIQDHFAHKPDSKQEILDEMVSQQVFEILGSTYGEDASLEMMFGQGNPVKLFGGFSNDVFYQELYPDKKNPVGFIFLAFSEFHSNFFALSRIITAFKKASNIENEINAEIFAINRMNPGMPLFPVSGEKYQFIRHAARDFVISGKSEAEFASNGEPFHLFIHHSRKIPQFIFSGVIKLNDIKLFIFNRLQNLILTVFIIFIILAILSFRISREITMPLKVLTSCMNSVKNGNYSLYLTFNREDELEEIALAFNDMQKMLSEKNTLAAMVSESAAEMASSDELEKQAMKGIKKEAVVLYFGIKSFKEMISANSEEKNLNLLKEWVSDISAKVIKAGGEVDKIMEGKLLAVFFPEKESLQNTHENFESIITFVCQKAMEICDEAKFPTACGIHFGNVICGLMGNEKRRDHTVIGDTVNLAARCFSLSEQDLNDLSVICTEKTVKSIKENIIKVKDLGKFPIKGKKEPQNLFKLES